MSGYTSVAQPHFTQFVFPQQYKPSNNAPIDPSNPSHKTRPSATRPATQSRMNQSMDDRDASLRRSAALFTHSSSPQVAQFKTCHYTELQDTYQKSQSSASPLNKDSATRYDFAMQNVIADNAAYLEEMKAKREEVEIFLKKMRARRGDTQVPLTRREHRQLKESMQSASPIDRPPSPYTNIHWATINQQTASQATHQTPPRTSQPVNQPTQSFNQANFTDPLTGASMAQQQTATPASAQSNIDRFWQEENERKRHYNHHCDSRELRRRRQLGQLAMPSDPQQAREMWERMKEQMWQHWEATQQSNDQPTVQSAEKPSTSPAHESTINQPTNSSNHSTVKPSSLAEPVRESPTKPSTAPQRQRTPSPVKRPTSAAQPNLVPPPSAGGFDPRPQTPLKARSSSYHPPLNHRTPPAGRATSPAKPYAHMSQPVERPRTAAPKPVASPPVVTPLSAFHSAVPTELAPAPYVSSYSSYTIKQLMDEMERLGLSVHDCVEKIDMIQKLEYHDQQRHQLQMAQMQQKHYDRECEKAIIEIDQWVKHKSIQTLLNELNASFIAVGTMPPLTLSSSLQDVERVYRRTLLTIHPDKVPHDNPLHKFKATEVFKVIHARFKEFRDQFDSMHHHSLHPMSGVRRPFRQ